MTDVTTRTQGGLKDHLGNVDAHGRDFGGYVEWCQEGDWSHHAELMRRFHEQIAFNEAERAAIERIAGTYLLLALVDAGCPDVVANLPIMARIAELNPRIRLRIVHRPDHWDIAYAIADAYPRPAGDYRGADPRGSFVPTYVLFDEVDNDLAVLIERPDEVSKFSVPRRAAAHREFVERYPGVAISDIPRDYMQGFLRETIEWRWGLIDLERAGVVEWLVNAVGRNPAGSPTIAAHP